MPKPLRGPSWVSWSLMPRRAPSLQPCPLCPTTPQVLSSSPREVPGCECQSVSPGTRKAHYLEVENPRWLVALSAGVGVGETLALSTWPVCTLSLRKLPRKPETLTLGGEGSLGSSGFLGF